MWQCDSFNWRHLPVAGGVYDQHPEFLEAAMMLHEVRGKYEEKKRAEQERKQKADMGKGRKGKR